MAKIIGGTVVTPMKVADLAQKNPLKADYVKGKDLVANSIKTSASGNPIRLDAVSPLAHEMKVSVDVGGATVNKLGKNIWKFDDMKHTGGSAPTKTENGLITKGGVGKTFVSSNTWLFPIAYLDGMDLTISCDVVPSGNNKPRLGLNYVNEDNVVTASIKETGTLGMNASIPLKVDITKASGGKYIQFRFCSNVSTTTEGLTSTDIATWSNFQIEIGNKTAYEPYHKETYTADENGKVNGIIGNGEDITLIGDGVTITAEYNADTKKYIDKKFAELQALVLEV